MRHVICISGDLASGKSLVGKSVSKKLGYEYFSAGNIFREVAGNLGISVVQLSLRCEKDPSVDRMIDSTIVEIYETRDRILFDSRMAWNFAGEGFKVYLSIDEVVAAKRVFADPRGNSEKYSSVEEALEGLGCRRETEANRYMQMYNVDICNMDNYHMVIDTTCKTPEQVENIIIEGYRKFQEVRMGI